MSQTAQQTGAPRPRLAGQTRSLLFLYGGSHRDLHRNALLCGQRLLGLAVTAPRYRLYDLGRYPGLVRDPVAGVAVRGELWAVHRGVLDRIDDYERAADSFRRELISVQGCPAAVPAYLYCQGVPATAPSGDRWPLPAPGEWQSPAAVPGAAAPFSLRPLLNPDPPAQETRPHRYRTGAPSCPRPADAPARAVGRAAVAWRWRTYPLNPEGFPGLTLAAPGFRTVPPELLADRGEPGGGWLRRSLRQCGFDVDEPGCLAAGFLRADWNGHPRRALAVVGERGMAVGDVAVPADAGAPAAC